MTDSGKRAAPLSPEQKLQELVQDLDAIVWETNPETLRFSFVSKRAEAILGYPVERLLEPGFFAGLLHPEDREGVVRGYRAAVREGTEHNFEYRALRSDGRVVWLRDRVRVVRDSDGLPRSVRGIMVDVTLRREAEQGLRESEDRYRQLVHRSPDAILVHCEGKIVYANVAAAGLLRAADPEELLGMPALNIVHPDYHEIVRQRIRAEEHGRSVEMIEEQFVRLDGSLVDVEVSGIPFTYEGKPAGQIVVRDITERKRTQNQLRDTEARYRALVESISAVLYIELPDTGNNTLYISPQIEPLLGVKPDEYLADPDNWQKFVHPDDRDRASREYEEFIATGQPEVSEYRMVAKDGRVAWIHDRSAMVRDSSGTPVLVQGVMFDVTEQKLAEERLRRRDAILEAVDFAAERFFGAPSWEDTIDDVLRALGEAAGGSRIYIWTNTRRQDGTLTGTQIFEWCAPGIPGQVGMPEFTDTPLLEGGWGRWAETLDSDGVIHGPVKDFPEDERAMLEKTGVRSLMAVPIFVDQERWGSIGIDDCTSDREWTIAEIDALRAAAGILGSAIQRQHTEAELRDAEEKFRLLVEHIPAVLYIDQPGTEDITTYISPQIERLFGFSPKDWMDDPKLWFRHLHPDDRDTAYETYHRGIATGAPFSYEYRMVTPKGVMWIRDDAVVLHTEEGKPLVQGVMFDVTEQKLAEEALLESETREREAAQSLRTLNEMKNTFLAAVSHELRSPLTAVLGLSLTLEQQELSDEERIDLLQRLATNARKLEKLLADLLDIDRLSRGVIQPQRHRTDVGALVRRTVESSDYLEGRDLHVEADPLVASVDSAKIERIVENLLVNAARHTAPDTTVWVKAFAQDGGVVIAIEDDGPGVPTELREVIFEPFRQGPTPSSHAPGTGIGLSLVLRFAELHGGRAWVEDRPGGGSSFRVFLPTDEGQSTVSGG